MKKIPLYDVSFDKGSGVRFKIETGELLVTCYVDQGNAFLAKKASPGQSFPEIFERYAQLVAEAALLNIQRDGVSSDIWGNLISAEDLVLAGEARRHAI